MSRVVSVIPAKPMQVIRGLDIAAKKRVCAYCRVSTDTEEQLSSYEAQVGYYEEYIKNAQIGSSPVFTPMKALPAPIPRNAPISTE